MSHTKNTSGSIKRRGKGYRSVALYVCDEAVSDEEIPHYRHVVRYCQADGRWSGSQPVCKSKLNLQEQSIKLYCKMVLLLLLSVLKWNNKY